MSGASSMDKTGSKQRHAQQLHSLCVLGKRSNPRRSNCIRAKYTADCDSRLRHRFERIPMEMVRNNEFRLIGSVDQMTCCDSRWSQAAELSGHSKSLLFTRLHRSRRMANVAETFLSATGRLQLKQVPMLGSLLLCSPRNRVVHVESNHRNQCGVAR
jgi:hypothetical protein